VHPEVPRVVSASAFMASTLCAMSSLFWWGPTPPQHPVTHFLQSDESLDYLLCGFQQYGPPENPA
jgi:hypothetical protein